VLEGVGFGIAVKSLVKSKQAGDALEFTSVIKPQGIP
jgi:hypothetical protein